MRKIWLLYNIIQKSLCVWKIYIPTNIQLGRKKMVFLVCRCLICILWKGYSQVLSSFTSITSNETVPQLLFLPLLIVAIFWRNSLFSFDNPCICVCSLALSFTSWCICVCRAITELFTNWLSTESPGFWPLFDGKFGVQNQLCPSATVYSEVANRLTSRFNFAMLTGMTSFISNKFVYTYIYIIYTQSVSPYVKQVRWDMWSVECVPTPTTLHVPNTVPIRYIRDKLITLASTNLRIWEAITTLVPPISRNMPRLYESCTPHLFV